MAASAGPEIERLISLLAKLPGLAHWPMRLHSYLPAPTVLLDGAFTGAGIGAGIFIFRRNHGHRA